MNEGNMISDVANFGARAQQFYQILQEEWKAAQSLLRENDDNEAIQAHVQVLEDLCDYYAELFDDIIVP